MEEEQNNSTGMLGLLSLTGGCGCAAGVAVAMGVVGTLIAWIIMSPVIGG